ncbi:MAG: AAA family ATPase [Methylophaga sp.]|nr:AAA family ATPase [Methylophaga sp.]
MSKQNDQLILISGESASGKSVSLMNLREPEGVMYLGCESGKRLPFKNKFQNLTVTDPYQVYEAFDVAFENKDVHTIVIDTLTFLMDMFETQYIIGAVDTMQGWSQYAQYYKRLMQEYVAASDKSVIFLAHTRSDLDEASMEMKTVVPVKGSLKSNGLEAYYSTVVSTKKMLLTDLEPYANDMLNITDRDNDLGYKHVFQTQLTKLTKNERIRSPIGMFTQKQTYMDNDAQLLLNHLREYYT